MRNKRNDESSRLQDWTTKKLKSYALSLHESIYGINSCHGVSDLILYESIIGELENRGVECGTQQVFN